ncbi:hypothetical protein DFQ27_004281 [Actinomortierella ambigua]|uniref:Transmembrane protein n=1 Tax=Actinomortierella ambigua TaxID=1343610 RepID=A0A9P6QNC3_9FUNG|nr:hypothetical protein DFQ27_004281 [Actinomortierella ambigua]
MNTTDKHQATINLAKGTAVAGLAGATAGATIGILRQKPVMNYAFSGGLNASLFGMTFIASREAFLRYQRAQNPAYGLKDSQTMSIDMLWSSTLAGAFTGGVLATLARGPKALPSGSVMFGLMGFSGQWMINRLHRMRQSRILASSSSLSDDKAVTAATVATGPTTTTTTATTTTTTSSSSPSSTTETAGHHHNHRQEEGVNMLLQVLPVRGTHMDDYEVKLQTRLDSIDKEMAFLQAEQSRRQQKQE